MHAPYITQFLSHSNVIGSRDAGAFAKTPKKAIATKHVYINPLFGIRGNIPLVQLPPPSPTLKLS